jgi:hypothetical protein
MKTFDRVSRYLFFSGLYSGINGFSFLFCSPPLSKDIAADMFIMSAYVPKHQEDGVESYCLSVLYTTTALHLPFLLSSQ